MVYMMKSSGPMTDPCGTPHVSLTASEEESLMETTWERSCKYDFSQFSTVPEIPNWSDRRSSRV